MKNDWAIERLEKRIDDLEAMVAQLTEMVRALEKAQAKQSQRLAIWTA